MKLYNTLTKQIEEFKPQEPNKASIYTCGPTVYDYPHVGNWFTFIRYDLLVRTLKAQGYETNWVMNITDVGHLVSDADEGEDKLEKGARREGKSAWDVAKHYSDYFVEGMSRLHFSKPDHLPRATDHIQEQIELIRRLENLGYTYIIDDGVYYDTSKFEGYAAFAQLDLEDQQVGARIEHNVQKRQAGDFALWKFSPKDKQRDMEWDSPWGKGFPGWHIECSAMSMKLLGETIDIHSGGIDHVPVHHTNEIAQSEAVTGKRYANYWMHTNHITVEGEKISKSLGNGITLEDIEERGISLEAFRLHILESHYRSQSRFSWESLKAAQNRLQAYKAMAAIQWQSLGVSVGLAQADIEADKAQILDSLQNDLHTPQVLTELSRVAEEVVTIGVIDVSRQSFKEFLEFVDQALGLTLSAEPDINDEQKQLITDRESARANQDWQRSDELRKKLEEQGVGLRDTQHGAIWHRL